MIGHTLPGLAIRQAERTPGMNHTKLPGINRPFGSGDGLGIHMDQRLPPIRDLLSGIPLTPSQPPYGPTSLASPLPSPIEPSPLFSNPFSSWSALPPRPQSVSGHYPGFFAPVHDLGPRRASAGCLYTTARSISLPSPVAAHPNHFHHHPHTRTSPDRDHTRQRRSSKQAARLRRRDNSPPSSLSLSPPPSEHETTLTAQANRSSQNQNNNKNNTNSKNPTTQATKEKRNNTPYTFEQEAFIIYHRDDLEMTWEQVRVAYMRRWPGLRRTTGGIQCGYYRTNSKLPAVTADGLLVLVDLDVDRADDHFRQRQPQQQQQLGVEGHVGQGQGQGQAQGLGGWAAGQVTPAVTPELGRYPFSHPPHPQPSSSSSSSSFSSSSHPASSNDDDEDEQEEMDVGGDGDGEGEADTEAEEPKKDDWYKFYRGVAYRTRWVPCRRGRYKLMERFPEELVDERNDWVREEHRCAAREIAERRRRQREEFLASKARQNH